MKNKKYIVLLIALFLMNSSIFAQDGAVPAQQNPISPGIAPDDTGNLPIVPTDPDATGVGAPKVADQSLTTVLIDDFEVPQGWAASIPLDFGVSHILYKDGSPQEIANDNNKMVLGVKAVFFRRNYGWMSIDRSYPLKIKHIVNNFSIWASGRNKRHTLFIKVRDILNNRMRLSAGEMRFQGWRKLVVPVSDAVIQFDPVPNNRGLDFLGLHIAFQAEDISTIVPYYVYFDQLTASMNMVSTQADDDVLDDW